MLNRLKREGISLESSKAARLVGKGKHFEKADYISGKTSNPHSAGRGKLESFYKEHGEGRHDPEQVEPKSKTKKIW